MFVYIIRAAGTNVYKVGISNAADARLNQLQKGSPLKLELVGAKHCEDAKAVESYLHSLFANVRSHYEWFVLDESAVATALKIIDNPSNHMSKVSIALKMFKDGASKTQSIKMAYGISSGRSFQVAVKEFDTAMRVAIFGEMHSGEQR